MESHMARTLGMLLFGGSLLASIGCDRSTQEKAREREAEARQKIRKLGNEAKQRVREADRDIAKTVQPDSRQAGAKLDDAALLAKVKTKLASDVGLATLKDINIDTHDSVVTLRGTVGSAAQRQEAERATSQVSGVSKVVNELKIAP
jgi:osmotically-inducible protein OsmY